MPFKSEAQRRWMFSNHPKMAKEWAAHTPEDAKLPERVKKAGALRDFLTEGHKHAPVKRALFHALTTPVRTGVTVGAPAGALVGAGVGAARAKKGERTKGAIEGAGKGALIGTLAGLGWGAGVHGGTKMGLKKGRRLHEEAVKKVDQLRAAGKGQSNYFRREYLRDKSAPLTEADKAWEPYREHVEKGLRNSILSGAAGATAAGAGSGMAIHKVSKKDKKEKVKHAFVMYESALREITRIGKSGK